MHYLLQGMKKHHSLKDGDKSYLMMIEAYLKHFTANTPYEKLISAFDMIRPLCHIYGALACFRLIEACGMNAIMSIQRGKLSDTLLLFAKSYT